MRDVPEPVAAVPCPAESSGAGEGAALLRSPRRFEPDRKTATQRLIERAAERKTTLEVTQGQILSQSPTDATSSR